MQDIYDYLQWRGDLSLQQVEFNKIDSLILSQLSYVELDGIVPDIKSDQYLALQKASNQYFMIHNEEELGKATKLVKETTELMKVLSTTDRFKGILLGKYVNQIDTLEQKQFSAMKVLLPDGSAYIVYRGTDTTMIGWREDFNMAYMSEVPSQKAAVNYLQAVINRHDRQVRLGGHSKGGNLAVYAAVNASKSIKKRILEVYNFDGPGFDDEMIKRLEYREILPMIHTYIPESSVIGRLLEHQEEYHVVKSSQPRLMQHDPFSWKIIGKEFIYANDLDKSSKLMEATIKTWISKLDHAQREQFVNAVFSLFDVNDIRTTDDLSKLKFNKIKDIIKTMNEMDSESKQVLNRTMSLLWKAARTALRSNTGQKSYHRKKTKMNVIQG